MLRTITNLFMLLCLSFCIFSCQDDSTIKSSNETMSLEQKNDDLFKNSFDLFKEMKAKNPELVMYVSKGEKGNLKVTYVKNADLANKGVNLAKRSSSSPELLCESNDWNEFNDCIKRNVDNGICVVITTAIYRAHECVAGQN